MVVSFPKLVCLFRRDLLAQSFPKLLCLFKRDLQAVSLSELLCLSGKDLTAVSFSSLSGCHSFMTKGTKDYSQVRFVKYSRS